MGGGGREHGLIHCFSFGWICFSVASKLANLIHCFSFGWICFSVASKLFFVSYDG